MKIPSGKLKAIIKYFCENTDSRFLGKTKLMKLFYFLDFTHVKKYGVSITGDEYYNLERGPMPSIIKNLVYEVMDNSEGAILSDTVELQRKENSKMHKIICLGKFTQEDKDYFSKVEFDTLKRVSQRFKDTNTKSIVDESHDEAPWAKTRELSKIPYSLAAKDNDCEVSEETIKLLSNIF